jgi:Fe-S-cluster containining protein
MPDANTEVAPEPARTLLKRVHSGRIELVWDGAFVRIEFNCSCLDALPFCKGMCCRQRVGYSVELEPDEVESFDTRPHPTRPGVRILRTKENRLDCVYLHSEKGTCLIHEEKPKMCRRWHCSPGGELDDEGIEVRDAGWLLMPMRKEEADLVQINLGGK